jgi:hypothetical protein
MEVHDLSPHLSLKQVDVLVTVGFNKNRIWGPVVAYKANWKAFGCQQGADVGTFDNV